MVLAAERNSSSRLPAEGERQPHLRLLAEEPVIAPRVSVIIPARNAADTIEETLRSLAAQRRVSWEAIVVDDGSTDRTAEIVKRWMRQDARLRLIQQPSAGVSAARNAGIAAATGEWLCFLDADDWLAPGGLARLLALARSNPEASVLVGAAARISRRGRAWRWPGRELSDAFAVLSAHCAFVVHSALVRRSVVRQFGGFDESLRSSEDWDLWQRIARAGHRFAQTDARVAMYRARPGSLSRKLPQAAHEGLVVLRRGHAPDERVPLSDARYAAGAPANALPTHELYYVLWSAARDIADGGDGLSTAALLTQDLDFDFEPDSLGDLMAQGMADMLACRPEELAPQWSQFEPKLRRVFDHVYPSGRRNRSKAVALGVIKARMNGARETDGDVIQLNAPVLPACTAGQGDFAVLQVRAGRSTLGVVGLPRLGAVTGKDVADAISHQVGRTQLTAALKAHRPWRKRLFWKAVGPAIFNIRGMGLRNLRKNPALLRQLLRHRARHALIEGLRRAVGADLQALAQADGPSAHREHLLRLRAQADELLLPGGRLKGAGEHRTGGRAVDPDRPDRAGSWDAFYDSDDPWDYERSDYERLKYQDTLELIPDLPEGSALELACSEGCFTARLAPRVGALLATDISAKVLERAARRCAGLANVGFQTLDFVKRPLPGQYDLIVCSEVLYYASRPLGAVAEKLARGLRPGGLLVMAHANQIADEPGATGFDWGHAFGARTIGEVFAGLPSLRLEREIQRPLYRVQAFRKNAASAARTEPAIERRPLEVTLEPKVARHVVWGGGESRIAALRREVAVRVPILMYHRVAPDRLSTATLERYRVDPEAFAQQIACLRSRGYWGVTPDQLAQALASNRPLPGRPVMITFDDGYKDFAEHAWPVLQKHDFPATLFVVPGKVGGEAEWDGRYGSLGRLLDWADIRGLAQDGVVVESHGLSHRALTRLPVTEIFREILNSQALIEKAAGRRPISICYPYGAMDAVVERAAQECGCSLGFSAMRGVASLADNPLRLPRVEVSVNDDLESFQRKLGAFA